MRPSVFETPVDEGLNWRPDYSRRFLVRDTRCSDHPLVQGDERAITVVDFDGRRLWVFADHANDFLHGKVDSDAYARARIASNEPALIYFYNDDVCPAATERGAARQHLRSAAYRHLRSATR